MKYIAKPVIVDAAKITDQPHAKGDQSWVVKLETGKTHVVAAELVGKYEPAIGDYYVTEEGGRSWIESASEFARKYEKAG